jgi:hypothetical protein
VTYLNIVFFDSPLLSELHSSFGNFTLKPGEQKTTVGTIHTPSELPNVPILLNWVIGAKDQDGRMGSIEFQQIINLTNMSSYERSTDAIHANTPLKQVRSGIDASKVVCNQGFQLIFKKEDGSPACVKPDTAQKLIERGWGIYHKKFEEGFFSFLLLKKFKAPFLLGITRVRKLYR